MSKKFELSEFKFRQRFWSPYDQYREKIGQKFKVLSVETIDEDGPGNEYPFFKIEFMDSGEMIDAWEEEVSRPEDVLVGGAHPPTDEELG